MKQGFLRGRSCFGFGNWFGVFICLGRFLFLGLLLVKACKARSNSGELDRDST